MRHVPLAGLLGCLFLSLSLGCGGDKSSGSAPAARGTAASGAQRSASAATAAPSAPAAYSELLGPPSGEPKLTGSGTVGAAGVFVQTPVNWGFEQDNQGGRAYAKDESAVVLVSPMTDMGFLKQLAGGKEFPAAGDAPFGPTPPKGREGFTKWEPAKIGDGTAAMVAKQTEAKEISYYVLLKHPKTSKTIMLVGRYKAGAADKEKLVIEVLKSVQMR